MQVLLTVSILWFTGSSRTILGIILGLLSIYVCHRGKGEGKREGNIKGWRSSASKLLKDQRADQCSPVLQTLKGPRQSTPLLGVSNPQCSTLRRRYQDCCKMVRLLVTDQQPPVLRTEPRTGSRRKLLWWRSQVYPQQY